MILQTIRHVVALLAFILWPTYVHACSLNVATIGSTSFAGGTGAGYDVFDPTVYYQPLTFRVTASDGACSYFATAAPAQESLSGGALAGTGGALTFEVYRDVTGTQPLRQAPVATMSDVLSGSVDEKKAATFQLAYAVTPLQVIAAGSYTGYISVALYEGKVGAGILRAQVQVPVTVNVPSVTQLSFADGGFDPDFGSYVLKFGTMHKGDLKGVNLRVRSNGGYRILLRSANEGSMRQTDPVDQSAVPYVTRIDGRPVVLGTAEVPVAQYADMTDRHGKTHRLDFEIGDIKNASAGDYQDIISIFLVSLR